MAIVTTSKVKAAGVRTGTNRANPLTCMYYYCYYRCNYSYIHGLVLVKSWVHQIVDAKGGNITHVLYTIIWARLAVGALPPPCQVLSFVANVVLHGRIELQVIPAHVPNRILYNLAIAAAAVNSF